MKARPGFNRPDLPKRLPAHILSLALRPDKINSEIGKFVMNNVRCARCAMVNWIGAGVCRRCGAQLAFIEEVAGGASGGGSFERRPTGSGLNVCSFCGTEFTGYFCSLCRKPVRVSNVKPDVSEKSRLLALVGSTKAKIIAASAIGLAAIALTLIVRWYGGDVKAKEFQTELISNSEMFRRPVTVSFPERGGELAPGVEVLEELGLVRSHVGVMTLRYSAGTGEVWTEETRDLKGEDPTVIQTKAITQTELTEWGRRESESWEQFETTDATLGPWRKSKGWRVPVGVREFIEVRQVYPAAKGTLEHSAVDFTWRWKPNTVGKHFDLGGEAFLRLPDAARQGLERLGFNNSSKIYTGTAILKFTEEGWQLDEIQFAQTDTIARQ
jgi:hypothetical protein